MKIIVSYRRSDSSATAGRIYDHLVAQFGQRSVFMDVDAIPFGTDFRSHIKEALLGGDILLAIIGPNWLGASPDGTRRIDDEADPVRVEVETALANGVTVVPVLIDGAPMPGANVLPAPLKDLAFLNAAPVDMGRDFRLHAERLSRALETILGAKASLSPPAPLPSHAASGSPGRAIGMAIAGLGLAALIGAGGWFALGRAPAPTVFATPAAPVAGTQEPARPITVAEPPRPAAEPPAPVAPALANSPERPSPPTPASPATPVVTPVVSPVPSPAGTAVATPRRSQAHGSFAWHELWTTNTASAETFYRAVMGWSAKTTGAGAAAYTTFSSGSTLVAGLATLPAASIAQGARPSWFGYVTVTDVDESAAQARSLGGTIHLGPADIPGIGRYALIADPQGASIVLLKSLVDYPMPAQAMGAASWRELQANDREAALGFYGALFGWTRTRSSDATSAGSDLLAIRSETFGAVRAKAAGGSSATWTYSFQVDGLEAAMARVRAAGGTVVDQPRQMTGGFWTVSCLDPQGAAFALMSKAR